MTDIDPLESSSLEADPLAFVQRSSTNSPNQPAVPNRSLPHFKRTLVISSLAVLMLVCLVTLGTILLVNKPTTNRPTTVAPITINTQNLDNGVLTKIINQAAPNETRPQLTVEPDTLFKKSVAVNGSLATTSNLEVGGNENIKGTSTIQGAVGINSNLAVRGALSVGGALSAGSLNVGSLAVSNVNASGNLSFGGHLVPSGPAPTATASVAAAGGTVSIEGNDTAGTVTVHVGNGSPLAGELAIVSFKTAFAGSPKVQLTPINGAAAGLSYYATRSAGFFTINSASTPASDGTYVFDYLVTE